LISYYRVEEGVPKKCGDGGKSVHRALTSRWSGAADSAIVVTSLGPGWVPAPGKSFSLDQCGNADLGLSRLRSEGHASKYFTGGRLLIGHELLTCGEDVGGKGIGDGHEFCRVRFTPGYRAVLTREG